MKIRNIFDELFFSTVRIEVQPEATPNERRFGTGFFVQRRLTDERLYTFLVTCRHVYEGAERGILYLMEGSAGEPLLQLYAAETNRFQLGWVPHPNKRVDVAVLLIEPLLIQILKTERKKLFLQHLREEEFVTDEKIREFNAIEDLTFVGYPAGLYDHKHGLPIARRAITASPMFLDFDDEPLFLLDGAVRRGSSGSPVFIAHEGLISKPEGMILGRRLHLVGVVAELREDPYHKQLADDDPYKALDLGVVYKPRTISETIDEWFRCADMNDSAQTKDRPPRFELACIRPTDHAFSRAARVQR